MAATTTPCCVPIAREPLSETDAADLAVMLKAVADPVRLRLLSMIGSHAGGEACVCDLTDAFDLTAPMQCNPSRQRYTGHGQAAADTSN